MCRSPTRTLRRDDEGHPALGSRRSRTLAATRSNPSWRRAPSWQEKGSTDSHRFWEFCEKVDLRLLNKRVLESLIKAGALDSLRPPRRSSWPRADRRWSARRRRSATWRRDSMDSSACSSDHRPVRHPATAAKMSLPNVPDWDENTRLQTEKEVLGFFVSGHPHGQVRGEAAQHERRGYGRRRWR